MESKVVIIDRRALKEMQSNSLNRFKDSPGYPLLDRLEIQQVLFIQSLSDLLIKNGVEPNFTLDPKLGSKK